jgi:hypothetical protein
MTTVETPYRASLQLTFAVITVWLAVHAGTMETVGATLVVALVLFAIITAMIAHTYIETSEYHLPMPPQEDGELPPCPAGTPPKEGNEMATTRVAPTNAIIPNFAGMATVETPYRASLQLTIGNFAGMAPVETPYRASLQLTFDNFAGMATVETPYRASLQLMIAVTTASATTCVRD